MKDDVSSHVVLRQSPVVLIAKIISIEILFFVGYLLSGFVVDYISQADQLKLLQLFSIDILVFLVLLIIQMVLTLSVALQWAGQEYEVIPEKLIQRKGVFSTSEESFSLSHIESLEVSQNLFGRMFNYGTITLFSPLNKQDIYLPTIQNPHKYKTLIEKSISTENKKTLYIRRDK